MSIDKKGGCSYSIFERGVIIVKEDVYAAAAQIKAII